MRIRQGFHLVRETVVRFSEGDAALYGAAIAFYTILSLAPLLLIVLAVAGFVFGPITSRQELLARVQATGGSEAAALVDTLISHVSQGASGTWATVVGSVLVIYGASRLISQLQVSLNYLWGIKPKMESDWKKTIISFLRNRLLAALMVFTIGVFAIIVLVVQAAQEALRPLAPSGFAWFYHRMGAFGL